MRTRLTIPVLSLALLGLLIGCGSTKSTSSGAATTTTGGSASLSGTGWTLESYQGQTGSPVNAAPRANATLEFDPTGSFGGSTGCNQFSGTYTTQGQSLSMTIGPMTQRACNGALLTAQQASLQTLIPQVTSFAITGDQLMLSAQGGATLLTYSAGLAGLAGTSWTATGLNNGSNAVESNALTGMLTASFAGDGTTFTGFAGCNDVTGTYAASGSDGLSITGLTSTQKSCAADANTIESQYTAALGKVATFAISGSTLTLRDSSGATQVTYRLAG